MERSDDKYLFGGNREKAISRDGGKCVVCGMTRQEHRKKYGRDITVDHIDGTGTNTPAGFKNNKLSNLQTMCLSCHGEKDRVGKPVMIISGNRADIIFGSIKDASLYSGANMGNIAHCCLGRQKHSGGYKWRYA